MRHPNQKRLSTIPHSLEAFLAAGAASIKLRLRDEIRQAVNQYHRLGGRITTLPPQQTGARFGALPQRDGAFEQFFTADMELDG